MNKLDTSLWTIINRTTHDIMYFTHFKNYNVFLLNQGLYKVS